MEQWKRRRQQQITIFILLAVFGVAKSTSCDDAPIAMSRLDRELTAYVDKIFSVDNVTVMPGVGIERVQDNVESDRSEFSRNCTPTHAVEDYFYEKWNDFSERHVVSLNLPQTARFLQSMYQKL